jgi:hypothetical protein
MTITEEILTRIAVALEKIAGDGITMHRDPAPDKSTPAALAEREDEAIAFIKANPSLTVENAEAGLAAMGIKRGRMWVKQTKMQLGLPVGRLPVAIKTEKPLDHRGLKMRESDSLDEYPDEGKLTAAEIQTREAFAIDVIKQNPRAKTEDIYSYFREHRLCGLHRWNDWIESHRPRD